MNFGDLLPNSFAEDKAEEKQLGNDDDLTPAISTFSTFFFRSRWFTNEAEEAIR